MSEQDLWHWQSPDFRWKRLDADEPGYVGDFVGMYLACVKSDAEFDVSTTEFQGQSTYYDRPREVVCAQIDDLADYSDWAVSVVRPAAHIRPWRPVWAIIIITVLKELGLLLIIEIKLGDDESSRFDAALAADA